MSPRHARISVSTLPGQVAGVRDQVVRQVGAWGVPFDDDTEEIIRLVPSELVTNAVVHAGGEVTVALYHHPGHLVIDVLDDSPTPPIHRTAETWEECGRGLELVDALAVSTGWEPTKSGKSVWALLKVPASAPEPAQRATALRQFFTRQAPTRALRALAVASAS
ncbi:ATP-binding protein [Streptomyces sp. NPDC059070]|uniref:ATP-binding protein n=1 Tax=Streptomyces sp. NPDC059070 TaxID=3346713 RepID=UPI0036774CC1